MAHVYRMLSDNQWKPIRVSELARSVVGCALWHCHRPVGLTIESME